MKDIALALAAAALVGIVLGRFVIPYVAVP